MTDESKTTESRPVQPVQVAIIGTGDGSRLPDGTQAETPGVHQPNIVVNVVQPLVAVCVRFINVFLIQFSGLLVAAMTPAGGKLLYAGDLPELLLTCASLSLPGACLGFVKDLVTIFGKLEAKYPLATGSI